MMVIKFVHLSCSKLLHLISYATFKSSKGDAVAYHFPLIVACDIASDPGLNEDAHINKQV
jgi:hypothetical protein